MSAFERSWNLLKERTEADDNHVWTEGQSRFINDQRRYRPASRWEQRHAPPKIGNQNSELAMHRAMLGPRRSRTQRMKQGRGHTYPDEPQTQMNTFREMHADATDEEGEPIDVSQMSPNDMLAYLDRIREQELNME